jgi:ribonuclease G
VGSEILINRGPGETRVALLEDGALVEIYVERDQDQGVVGNLYQGKVSRVLPGMQAAFLQIGLDRAAFLHADDIALPGEGADVDDLELEVGERAPRADRPSIGQLLREGQELLVQVAKAPLGTKGARVTNYVSLPGRYVVYMPTVPKIGVSRRIGDEAERERLKKIVETHRQANEGGFIVRTVCAGLDEEIIARDMAFVRSLWAEIAGKAKGAAPGTLLYADVDLVLRAARDLFGDEVERVLIDSPTERDRIKALLEKSAPHLAARVQLYEGRAPLFEAHGLEQELERALSRTIELRSGGSIVIDEAEALTAIDVNTGSFVGSKDLEATLLKTNLEAALTVARQVRLRNLGGIIIVDFIDLSSPENRVKVHTAFVEALTKDRAKTNALPISEFGLVEMTRRRVRPSLGKTLTEACPYCEGRGRVRSRRTVCQDILREIEQQARTQPHGDVLVSAMPAVAAMLTTDDRGRIEALEEKLGRPIVVEARGELHQEVYEVCVRTKSVLP